MIKTIVRAVSAATAVQNPRVETRGFENKKYSKQTN